MGRTARGRRGGGLDTARTIDGDAVRIECPERANHRVQVMVVPPERWKHRGRHLPVIGALRYGSRQQRVRAEFQKDAVAVFQQAVDG